jgi:transcription-repair coupling factor (superfamily II helicase)
LPQPVENLLYMVKMKQLAAEAGVESISTKGKQITIQFFEARELNISQLARDYRGGVKAGNRQITLDIKHLEDKWWEALEKILGAVK